MSDARSPLFEEAYDDLLRFDPMERVEFSFGMLLDVDEFEIEQAERVLRRRIHQALLHGYGTAVGLGVESRDDDAGRPTEIVVHPGWAVDALGRDLWLDQTMCLDISHLHEHPIWAELTDLDGVRTLWIVGRWLGLLDSRIPAAHVASCSPADQGLVYSRHRDAMRIDLADNPPALSSLPVDLLADGAGSTRDRWRDAIIGGTDALTALVRAWRGPSDAPLMLAQVLVHVVDDLTEIISIDSTARPILPAVQSVAEVVAGESLRSLDTTDWFGVENLTASEDGTDAVFRFELSDAVHPGSLSAVTASSLEPTDTAWQPVDLTGAVTLEDSDATIVVRIDASGFAASTFIEVDLKGAGTQPLLTLDGRPLQGNLDNPHVLAAQGADVTHRVSWPF